MHGSGQADALWWFTSAGVKKGPITEAQLLELLATKAVECNTLVWNSTWAVCTSAWTELSLVPGAVADVDAEATQLVDNNQLRFSQC